MRKLEAAITALLCALAAACGDVEYEIKAPSVGCSLTGGSLKALFEKCALGGAKLKSGCKCTCAGGVEITSSNYTYKSCEPMGKHEVLDTLSQAQGPLASVFDSMDMAEELMAGGDGTIAIDSEGGGDDGGGSHDQTTLPVDTRASKNASSATGASGAAGTTGPRGGITREESLFRRTTDGEAKEGIIEGGEAAKGTRSSMNLQLPSAGGGESAAEAGDELKLGDEDGAAKKATAAAATAAEGAATAADSGFTAAGGGGGGPGRSVADTGEVVTGPKGPAGAKGDEGLSPSAGSIFELVRPHYLRWAKTVDAVP